MIMIMPERTSTVVLDLIPEARRVPLLLLTYGCPKHDVESPFMAQPEV